MDFQAGNYDIAVIGGGHAGIEAALACARLGLSTILFTLNLDAVGNMPCNPSLGGSAKGQLVSEIDALGGQMAHTADKTLIQWRLLNKSKGPAVQAIRIQSDRREYQEEMKRVLERQKNLAIKQAEIVEIFTDESRAVTGLCTHLGAIFSVRAIIVATGTYLAGRIIVGDVSYDGGPDGMFAASTLSRSLRKLGIELMRFKTGTPARVLKSSIDFSKMQEQPGEEPIVPFSYFPGEVGKNEVGCHLGYTNEKTHEIIRQNLHRSPLFSGNIEGVGPRYCPSIEDKVVRFADKERHQLFIEPMGKDTDEMYIQGMSSSLPEDVQLAFLRTVKGLEKVHVMRTAYAIEYDCANPLQLLPTLEFKTVSGLFGAGQFNGTSGYEEAAAQGLIAGINAAMKLLGRDPLVLPRSSSYIGTLIDDLVTKGTTEPYRMMTSRSEYRLLLRQDNADERLAQIGRDIGLVGDERYRAFGQKQEAIGEEMKRLAKTTVPPSPAVNALLEGYGQPPLTTGAKLADLIKRPSLSYDALGPIDKERPLLQPAITLGVEVRIKYEGYIKRQQAQAHELARMENKLIPEKFDYLALKGLRIEAQQKLAKVRPRSIGQAARISGVNPADIAVLLICLSQEREGKHDAK